MMLPCQQSHVKKILLLFVAGSLSALSLERELERERDNWSTNTLSLERVLHRYIWHVLYSTYVVSMRSSII